MQLIVPMAGFGRRFARAGYDRPKPLIEVHGQPMISHVLSLFPGVDRVLLLCNEEHLHDPRWQMAALLAERHPEATVVGIEPHRRGPVHTLLEAAEHIDPADEVMIAMCDLFFDWDFDHVRQWVRDSGAEGVVVCYRGFHPHLLHSVHYAFLQHEGRWATAIQEKSAYTDDPIANAEFCSNGVYGFSTGALALDALRRVHEQPELAIEGEHYVSQAYGPLLEDGRGVCIYEVEHFCQWGNPRDLVEYERHARGFALRASATPRAPMEGTVLVPMAGLGSRFAERGYTTPKPLLPVLGRPMVVAATMDLPAMTHQVFVTRDTIACDALKEAYPDARVVVLDGPTEGQACTVLAGLSQAVEGQPVVVGTCDNGLLFDPAAHEAALERYDLLVWGVRGHPAAALHPEQFSWIEEGEVRISVKQPLGDPIRDLMVVGAFSARSPEVLARCIERQIARDGRSRGEFYLDGAMEDAVALGYRVGCFEVDHYEGWGTPDEWLTWRYWARYFHLRPEHPYRADQDPRGTGAVGWSRLLPVPLPPRG